jgi:hypothetical protein
MPQIHESEFEAAGLQDTIDGFVRDLLNIHPPGEVRALAAEIVEEQSGAVLLGVIGELAEHLRRTIDFRDSVESLLKLGADEANDADWIQRTRTVSLASDE